MKKRLFLINITIFFFITAIVLRLVNLTIVNHEKYSERLNKQTMAKEKVQVRRGLILDRMGRRLAVNLESCSVYFYKKRAKVNAKALYEKMSPVVDLNYKELSSKYNRSSNFMKIKSKLPMEISDRILELKIDGVAVEPDVKRFYTLGEHASHILGFTGTDGKGLEGIELQYEKFLTNNGGEIVVSRDARGNTFYNDERTERQGNHITLTIDETLQYIVEQEIESAMNKWKAEAATIVMMNPYSGEILALSNRPTYDPNNFGRYKASDRRNRAVTDIFEPGSTFKAVTATAALEEGVVNTDDVFDCSKGYIEKGGKRIRDSHRLEELTFLEVIQKSSNVGTIMIADRLGKKRLYEYIQKFGFGERTGIDMPGEVSGSIKKPSRWSGVTIGSVAIGHEIAVTSLQMVKAYAIIANGGFDVTPRIVKSYITPDGMESVVSKNEKKERIFSRKTVSILKKALVMVTEEEGTARFATVEGNMVAGKTGTAQIFDSKAGRYSHKDYVSSFIGFVPADNPKFVMIVSLWKPRGKFYGGLVAAPSFKNIAEKALSYLNVPRDDYKENNLLVVMNNHKP